MYLCEVEERKTYFVDVILPLALNYEFTYRVPYEMNDYVKSGIRVVVPFGKSKLQTAIITKVHEEIPKKYAAKYIEHILDDAPIITSKQYKLWNWISDYYMSPIGDVMNAALPSNFKLASETKIILHPDFVSRDADLADREQQIVDALEVQDKLDLKEISEMLGIKTVQPIIKKMIDKKIVMAAEELKHKFTPKTQLFVEFSKEFQTPSVIEEYLEEISSKKSKSKQFDAIMTFLKLGGFDNNTSRPIPRRDIEKEGISVSSINTLEKNGVFNVELMEISRLNASDDTIQERKTLSESQLVAYNQINASFEEKNVCLLHGVTGSGKTEVYVELIQDQLEQGNHVLYLLPEIALTTQLITRLKAYFGDLVGVYHSKFNANERIEIWNTLLENNPNKFRIIIGARSCTFLPFQNLGLVIVDEEHESSFKQYDPSPRYNARDAAIVLAHLHGAKTLLGSATPAIETFYNASNGKYGLVTLDKRFGDVQLPEIFTADLKKERRQKTMHSHFSSFLLEHIKEALDNNEQIILFQNRRGYTPLWSCEICSWTPKCVNCDISLTYHKHSNTLKCHYCSYYIPPVGTCKDCGSNRLKMLGFGTEKIEDELSLILPTARIQRLDLDTTRQKNAYSKILDGFENREIDILVGTQMVTKGLDFDNVSLVGVLDADMILNRPDFRAFERSYQLMSQVAGRAGRKQKRGKVIIQTGNTDHWIIQRVIEHDYLGLYTNEIVERRNYNFPPFYKLINFTIRHRKQPELEGISAEFGNALKAIFGNRVNGPETPVIGRIQNYYIKTIQLKIEKEASPKKVKLRIHEIMDKFYSSPGNKACRVSIDVDPM